MLGYYMKPPDKGVCNDQDKLCSIAVEVFTACDGEDSESFSVPLLCVY